MRENRIETCKTRNGRAKKHGMQELYADIIVDISHEKLDKVFQFRIPEELQSQLKVGMVAEFPFGAGNRLTKGFVVGIGTECAYDKTKVKS